MTTDLHALLHEPGPGKDFDGVMIYAPPLATRIPECVPAGLVREDEFSARESGTKDKMILCLASWYLDGQPITDEQAEHVCGWQWLKVLRQADWFVQFRGIAEKVLVENDHGVHHFDGDPLVALAAALHRLADETPKETPSDDDTAGTPVPTQV